MSNKKEHKFQTLDSIKLQDETTPEWLELQDDFIATISSAAKERGIVGAEFWNIGMMLGFDKFYPEKFANGTEA